jgi:hypothetical protein
LSLKFLTTPKSLISPKFLKNRSFQSFQRYQKYLMSRLNLYFLLLLSYQKYQ